MTQIYFLQHETHQQLQEADELAWTGKILKYVAALTPGKVPCRITIKKTLSQSKELTVKGKSFSYLEQKSGEVYKINEEKKKIKITMQQYKQTRIADHQSINKKTTPWLEWSIKLNQHNKLQSGIIIIHTNEATILPDCIEKYLTTHTNEKPNIEFTSRSTYGAQMKVTRKLSENYRRLKAYEPTRKNKDNDSVKKNEKPVKNWKSWLIRECIKKCPQYCFALVKRITPYLAKIVLSTLIGYFFNHKYIYMTMIIILLIHRKLLKKHTTITSEACVTRDYINLGFEYFGHMKTLIKKGFEISINKMAKEEEQTKTQNTGNKKKSQHRTFKA